MRDLQDHHYEDLYNRLLERGKEMHSNNKRRIRIGLIVLALLPVILMLIRWLTDSDRVVFLLIWVLCMFAACIYLISIEFIDHQLQKTLEDVTKREADFDELLIGAEQFEERILERHGRIHERRQERRQERMENRLEHIEEMAGASITPAESEDEK